MNGILKFKISFDALRYLRVLAGSMKIVTLHTYKVPRSGDNFAPYITKRSLNGFRVYQHIDIQCKANLTIPYSSEPYSLGNFLNRSRFGLRHACV